MANMAALMLDNKDCSTLVSCARCDSAICPLYSNTLYRLIVWLIFYNFIVQHRRPKLDHLANSRTRKTSPPIWVAPRNGTKWKKKSKAAFLARNVRRNLNNRKSKRFRHTWLAIWCPAGTSMAARRALRASLHPTNFRNICWTCTLIISIDAPSVKKRLIQKFPSKFIWPFSTAANRNCTDARAARRRMKRLPFSEPKRSSTRTSWWRTLHEFRLLSNNLWPSSNVHFARSPSRSNSCWNGTCI